MADIRLSEFQGDTIVVHFGGPPRIDAYTFAYSLIGFADTARAISNTIDPGQEIEIVLEADGLGSYRARVRRVKKGYGGILSGAAGAVFWGVVANVVYDATLKNDSPPQVTVNSNEIIVKHGPHTIIVPRTVHDAAENAKRNPAVQRGLRKTFEPLREDKNVTDFGLTRHLEDKDPYLKIPRAEFPNVAVPAAHTEEQPSERTTTETARLVILKAWLNHARRKWSFEWNGVPLSAPIVDGDFLDRLARRDHLLGAGDALDVEITFKQKFDRSLGVYVNDQSSFAVTKVIKVVSKV